MSVNIIGVVNCYSDLRFKRTDKRMKQLGYALRAHLHGL